MGYQLVTLGGGGGTGPRTMCVCVCVNRVILIMTHIRVNVAFGLMSFGLVRFSLMSHSAICCLV